MENDQIQTVNEDKNLKEQFESTEKPILTEEKSLNDVEMSETIESKDNETETIVENVIEEESIQVEETKKDGFKIEEVEMTESFNYKADELKKIEEIEPKIEIPQEEKPKPENFLENNLTEVIPASEIEVDQTNETNVSQPLEETSEVKKEQLNETELVKDEEEKTTKTNPENSQVNSSQQSKKPKIDLTLMQTRQYLDHTIVPILFGGLSSLAKARPENPIEYLANYLLENKSKYDNQENSSLNGNQ